MEMQGAQFIKYLQGLEEANPNRTWHQIITRLQNHFYAHDEAVARLGVRLFVDGPENEGWLEVNFTQPPPKWIRVHGERIDIAHAYCAIRGGLNRPDGLAWVMRRVNSSWGDLYQVWADRLVAVRGCAKAGLQIRLGHIQQGLATIKKSTQTWKDAPQWLPADQEAGNLIGLQVAFVMRHHTSKLSEGFAVVLRISA